MLPANKSTKQADRTRQLSEYRGIRSWISSVVLTVIAALAASAVCPVFAAGPSAIATDSRLGGDDKRTRFIMDMNRNVPFRVFALADPHRVIVDMPEIEFHLDPGIGQTGRGLVAAYRYGLLAVGKSRIVLDVSAPVLIDKAFVLPPQDGQPARLVIDLVSTDRQAFLAQIAKQSKPVQPRQKEASLRLAMPGDPDDDPARVVVIDPGHGGIDTGAISPHGSFEKDIVLAFSRILQQKLEASGGYKVLLTRDGDAFLRLDERVEFGRRSRADLFISVHADKFHTASVRGATVYTLSEDASDAEAEALAAKENKADVIAGIDLADEPGEVSDILIDLARRETKNFSVSLARSMVGELRDRIQLNKNPLRSAGFRVLTAPDVPSILLELGYVSNESDVRDLASKEWRDNAAEAVVRAVGGYFAVRSARTPN